MDTLLFFFLNRSFLDKGEKNQKPVFSIREPLPFLYVNLKWRAKFQISWLRIRDSDWLHFIHFSGYKYKIRLVSRLRKKVQALISISIILKFSAQVRFYTDPTENSLKEELSRNILIYFYYFSKEHS